MDKITDNELKKNGSGYPDPTAYEAIKHVEMGEEERFYKLLHTIFHVCECAGFMVKGRINLVDRKTGRVWE